MKMDLETLTPKGLNNKLNHYYILNTPKIYTHYSLTFILKI